MHLFSGAEDEILISPLGSQATRIGSLHNASPVSFSFLFFLRCGRQDCLGCVVSLGGDM